MADDVEEGVVLVVVGAGIAVVAELQEKRFVVKGLMKQGSWLSICICLNRKQKNKIRKTLDCLHQQNQTGLLERRKKLPTPFYPNCLVVIGKTAKNCQQKRAVLLRQFKIV